MPYIFTPVNLRVDYWTTHLFGRRKIFNPREQQKCTRKIELSQKENATWDEQTDIDLSAQVTNRPMGPPRGQNKRDSTTSSMIAMLLAASVAYLVLKTPYHLYTILVPVAGEQGRTVATSTIDWAAVGLGLVGAAQLMNHGINFYLYVITGREFRRVLKRSVCGRSKKSDLELSTMKTVSSTID
ncbi:hypothetical protein CAPTEDRAFT_209965 [Capitella teleta]|uniref:G-protein coupled receptors family 1 profile domain-containing protein n=1 Tax=Capitella teleta TaxID=283909 RepID=R7UTX5_CAPTE|nr:hypothetical protein CAPTEDRAFT_209965 [Capitella teleta]|eukprot:ELU09615.1 hypothetical protein CAPTEDRAFT_209965 [Capitella teleta]